MAINWSTVIFNMLTIKGIYGREMYETWYKMTVMIQSGLDIEPGNHPPAQLHRLSSRVLRHALRKLGQSDFNMERGHMK